ncbi:g4494 [Coccomyxa elongata]
MSPRLPEPKEAFIIILLKRPAHPLTMGKLSAMIVLVCLCALTTIEARRLHFAVGAYQDNTSMPGSSYQATGGSAAQTSSTLPPIQLPTLSQIKAFFDAFPGPNIFDALAPALAPAPAMDMAPQSAPIGGAMAPATMGQGTMT